MRELLINFVQEPSQDNFLALRTAIIGSEQYSPYSNEMERIHSLIEEKKWSDAKEAFQTAMPNLMLSPRAHLAMSFVANRMGDEKTERFEGFLASACCQGVIESGGGTKDSPYLVTRTSDEHDVVEFLQKTFAGQSLLEADGRTYDLIKCTDGTEIWFDISDCYKKLMERFS